MYRQQAAGWTILLLALVPSAGRTLAGPFQTSNWADHALSVAECVNVAQKALRGAGVEITHVSAVAAIGETNDRTIQIYCEIPHVVFVAASDYSTAPNGRDLDVFLRFFELRRK